MKFFTRMFGKLPILELRLVPHVGVGPILLGMTKDEVTRAMKACGLNVSSNAHGHLYFFENSIMVEFHPTGDATFIGVSPNKNLRLTFQNTSLFDMEAKRVFHLFQKHEEVTAEFDEYEHIFPRQIVTLWDADAQYDQNGQKTAIWGQIGIGDDKYLKAGATMQT